MATFKYDGEIMARALLSHHLDTAVTLAGEAGLGPVETLALTALANHAAAALKPAWAVVDGAELATPSPSNPFTLERSNREARKLVADAKREAAPEPVNRKVAAKILGVSTKTLDKWTASGTVKKVKRAGPPRFDPDYLRGIDAAALMLRRRRK